MDDTQTTLRDTIAASFDSVETASTPETVIEAEPTSAERARDEAGKFAKEDKPEVKADVFPDKKEPEVQVEAEPKAMQRPSTWKKEYLPIWDKIAAGQPLTPDESKKLANYSEQRESEYKTGVSTYKAEAESAKQLQQAIAPFLPELQKYNINPTQWIQNLGNSHRVLSLGTAEQKLQMFTQLAKEYGVPLNSVSQVAQGGQVDPAQLQLMQEIQDLKSQVGQVAGWREQQETQALLSEIDKVKSDAENYPHFELVRGTMAQLLENGQAPDLQTAYKMAAQPIEDMLEQRLAQVRSTHASPAQVVSQAKAKAVSTKSSTPSGIVTTTNAKDRRAVLEEQVNAMLGGSRV